MHQQAERRATFGTAHIRARDPGKPEAQNASRYGTVDIRLQNYYLFKTPLCRAVQH